MTGMDTASIILRITRICDMRATPPSRRISAGTLSSAITAAAQIVQPLTQKVMADKNIDIKDQFPKGLMSVEAAKFDLVVNMSGSRLPNMPVEVRQWKVADPIGETEDFYVTVRDQIENEVMRLIIEFRREMREKDGANRPTRKRRTHIVPPRNSEAPQP